jgi:tRNA(Met) C34 N-acetyltransferase TmcA
MFKNYLQDIGRVLIFTTVVSGVSLVSILGQPLDKPEKEAIAIFVGILSAGGVLAVTLDHSRTWQKVISEHFANSTVEIDMDNLQQRISEVQQKDS